VLLGAGHIAAQCVAVSIVSVLVVRLTGRWWDGGWGAAAVPIGTGLVAGLGSAFVLGLYFIFAMTVLWRQTGHGFAPIRIEGIKAFCGCASLKTLASPCTPSV
jgi:hypothetical protein